jgi:molybdopterin/thiamine biosynthesis adenylyltransferase
MILASDTSRVKYIMAHIGRSTEIAGSMLGRGMKASEAPVVPTRKGEDRFDRSRRIPWFDLDRTRRAHVLVVGAGALGNEVVKNLVLAGVRRITLVDMDHVVASNLNRCVFFTPEDAGTSRPKVDAVAAGAARLDGSVEMTTENQRIEDLGEGVFTGKDAVVGCLDNLATRVHVNANAYWMRIPYVDGGTMGLMGKVHVVVPPDTSCVECTLNSSHYRIIEQRYSCTGADTTFVEPKMASEVTTTALVAAVQSREVMKIVNGRRDLLLANLFYYDGNRNVSDVLEVAINPDCPNHGGEPLPAGARASEVFGRGD